MTVALQFRAETTERELLPRVLAAGTAMHPEALALARAYCLPACPAVRPAELR